MTMEDPRAFTSRPAYRKIGVYLLGLTAALLSVSVLVYSLMMQGIGWPIDLSDVASKRAMELTHHKINIQLYAAESTREYFEKAGGNYQNLLSPWQNYFRQKELPYSLISQPDQILAVPNGILVLPSAVALSETELRAIFNFQKQGGSLLLTWATGTRHADGSWRSWDFLEKISNSKFIGEHKPDTPLRYLFLRGESPLTHELDSGQSVWLGNTHDTFLRLRSLESDAWFLDKNNTPPRRDSFAEGAILHTEATPDMGRAAVFCFPETTWEYQPHRISKILDGTLDWLARIPTLKRSLWPQAREAAQIVTIDLTGSSIENAINIRKQLGAQQIPVSYLVDENILTDAAWNQNSGPKASFETLRTLRPSPDPGKPNATTANIALTRAATTTQDPSSSISLGIHTGALQMGAQPLHAAGYRHQVNHAGEWNSRQPQFAALEKNIQGDRFVVLPDGQESVTAMIRSSKSESEQQSVFALDLLLTRESSSLGFFNLQSDEFNSQGVPLPSVTRHLGSMKEQHQSLWLATANDVSQWWRKRENFKLRTRYTKVRIEFDITILGNSTFEGASLVLQLPQKGKLPRVKGQKIGSPDPTVNLRSPYVAIISFEPLKPGNYAYTASF